MNIPRSGVRYFLTGCIIILVHGFSGFSQTPAPHYISDPAAFQSFIAGLDQQKKEGFKPIADSLTDRLIAESSDSLSFQVRSAYILVRYILKFPDPQKLDSLVNWVKRLNSQPDNEADVVLLIRVINNLGVALKRNSRITESQETYFKAIEILKRMPQPDVLMLGSLYANVGNIYRQKGEYESSLSYFQQAIAAFTECISDPARKDKPVKNKVQSLNNLGLVYQNLNMQDQAVRSFYECINLIEMNEIDDEDMAYTNLTNSLIETGRLNEADSICRRIIETRKDGEEKDRIYVLASINLAQLKAQLHGDTVGAVNQFENLRKEIRQLIPQAYDLKTEAVLQETSLLKKTGNFEKAITLSEQAINEISINPDKVSWKNSPSIIKSYWGNELINLLLDLAGTYKTMGIGNASVGELRMSVKYFSAVTSLIDSLRAGLQLQSSQMELSRRQEGSFDEMVDLAYRLYSNTKDPDDLSAMFDFIEMSKSAGLWSSIRESAKKKRILTEDDLRQEVELNKQIVDIQILINEQLSNSIPNSTRLKDLQDLNFSLNQKKDSLARAFSRTYPELGDIAGGPELITLQKTARVLGKNDVMLQFSYSAGTIYCIAITSDNSIASAIPLDSVIREDLQFLLVFMKGRYTSFDRKEKQSFKQAATHLYASLLGPFEDLIGSRNLIIIPDGPLNLIPFEALIAPDPEKNSDTYLSFNYLIKNHMISYGLSATLWNYKSGSRNKPAKGILAVAPEYDPDIIAQSELLRAKADALPPLKGTVEESRSARRMISGRLLTGSKARESTFKKICNDFSVIHLAMHTVTDPNDPLNTFLVFTPGADHEDDGLLYSREIYNLDLGASLVVLSACETGSGEMAAGEGIISLGRGFLFAGCSNMIITLWTVDDVSGKTIMKMFYRNLRSGQSISNALRNSKLTYIDQADEIHAHPYFWAAFSAVGPDNMVELRHGNMMIWYILLAVMIVLAATYSFVQKRKSPPSGGDISETD